MIDYNLKFSSQEEAYSVLAEYLDGENGLLISDYEVTIFDIGTIQKPTGIVLDDGNGYSYPEMAAIDGYHVNIRARTDKPELLTYCIYPATPSYTFGPLHD